MTFDEVFEEMLKRLEEANKKIAQQEMIIEEQESTIENLYRQLDRKSKHNKKSIPDKKKV